MKIGLLGGTFNPPHLGHLLLAQCVLEQAGLDKIVFIPVFLPPHKEIDYLADAKSRLNMLKLSISGNDRFNICDWELQKKGVSYTIDTLKYLRSQSPYKEDDLYLILGPDLALGFKQWKSWQEIKKIAKIVVGIRKEKEKDVCDKDFICVDIISVGISSSLLRERIRNNLTVKYLVKDEVASYIEKNNLYRKV